MYGRLLRGGGEELSDGLATRKHRVLGFLHRSSLFFFGLKGHHVCLNGR